MGDITNAIDNEVNLLQNKLRETLREEEERGANLRNLGTRAEHLEERAGMFQTSARDVRRKLWWRSIKWIAIAASIGLLLVIVVYVALFKK